MRALLLVALALALVGCAKPIRGWSVAGADVAVHFNRNSEDRTETSSSINWPPVDTRSSHMRSQNSGGVAVTLHLRYEPKRKRVTPRVVTRKAQSGEL